MIFFADTPSPFSMPLADALEAFSLQPEFHFYD
jgi:hypothetical protein